MLKKEQVVFKKQVQKVICKKKISNKIILKRSVYLD